MDDTLDFFDFKKSFERVQVQASYANQKADNNVFDMSSIVKREESGNEYSKVFKEAEKRQFFQNHDEPSTSRINQSKLNELDDEDMDDSSSIAKFPRKDEELYSKYDFESRIDVDLPINECKMNILSAIRENQIIILQGDTGCGKTTQVPQFILDDAYSRREPFNIICTQPRRIAAISIAERVCYERMWQLGEVVGYQIGLHAKASSDTRLLYCTTGILLQKLIAEQDMSRYTHVILDEVHERDQEMDFLLIIVRRLLASKSRKVKVILMSATIDANQFSEYFKMNYGAGAPIIKVDTRRMYHVQEFYLDDIKQLIESNAAVSMDDVIAYNKPGINDLMYRVCLKLIIICHKLCNHPSEGCDLLNQKPSVLIFLPGAYEIERMDKEIQKLKEIIGQMGQPMEIMCVRLHSLISPDEQSRVFCKPPKDTFKIILATNIAESSITVPDVKFVIDFCLTKSLFADTNTNFTTLKLHWSSRANCKQRAGRAGRVMNGRVYRLISRSFYENELQEHTSPEMIRCPLDSLVLKSKLLNMGSPPAVLGLAMDPPNLSDIRNTILTLKEVGALYKTVQGKYEPFDGNITFIGRVMTSLPVSIYVSKLIILGNVFSVLEEAIIIGAGLSVRNVFTLPAKEGLKAYSQKLTWSDGTGSDLIAILRAYTVWLNMKNRGDFNDEGTENSWAGRYYINTKGMREMHLLIEDIKSRLHSIGIKDTRGAARVRWLGSEKTVILKIVIAGAFYPNYFLQRPTKTDDERDVYRAMDGRDPCNTVFFKGFDKKLIGQLYVHSIKEIFTQAGILHKNIEVRFSEGSQKIFVTFKDDSESSYNDAQSLTISMPGRIKLEVYKALKIRQLRLPTDIKVMKYSTEEIRYAQKMQLGSMKDGVWVPNRKRIVNPELIVIPSLDSNSVKGKVTHIEHCGKFWFQPLSEERKLKEFRQVLNEQHPDMYNFDNKGEISKGMMVAAPFIRNSNNDYQRARVISLVGDESFRVLFVDFGNFETIPFKSLRRLGIKLAYLQDIPPRIFECYLHGVQPSSINCPEGKWSVDAIREMKKLVNMHIVEIEVYSVVNGITSAILKCGDIVVNKYLIDQKFAQPCEENYMSQHDHDFRARRHRVSHVMHEHLSSLNTDHLYSNFLEDEICTAPAPPHQCLRRLELQGPFSPLEAKIYAAVRIGNWKSVNVERESVNSIILRNDSQGKDKRFMVAASVTENNDMLTARYTTVMPNIDGIAPLMGLLFCPTMQLHRNKHKTKYVSILAGLGVDENGRSLFEEHDIVFDLDTEITTADLVTINQIRYSMDTILFTFPESGMSRAVANTEDLKAKIKNLIIELMEKQRQSIEDHHFAQDHVWSKTYENEDIIPAENIYGERAIFPTHSSIRLYSENFDRILMLREHCADLHNKSTLEMTNSNTEIKCQLCRIYLETIADLRIHLLSQLHLDRERQIGYEN